MAEEHKLQTKILKDLRSYKQMMCFKIMKCSDNGIPDIFFTNKITGPCLLEVKRSGEKPSSLQFSILSKLNICGVTALWCSSWEEWVKIKKIINLSHDMLS
jgi:hypothetical protein